MVRLIPKHLATAAEIAEAKPEDFEQAKRLRVRARRIGRNVSLQGWRTARANLGRHFRETKTSRDKSRGRRAIALQIISAATGYRPLPKQLALHTADHRDRVDKFFAGGVGTGKSTSAVVEDLICVLCLPGVRGLIVAPTYDQALHVLLPIFLRFCEQMEQAGYPILRKFYWSQMRAELVCGGEVFFRSVSKVDNILGFEFAWIHLDESETISNPELVWETLTGRCRFPAPFRQMLGTSTPRGLRGVIGKFQTARESFTSEDQRIELRARFFFVRATTLENPHLPPDYVESLRRMYSKQAWDQEVLAKILRPDSAVYPEFERARHEFKWEGGKAAFIARLAELGVEYDIAYDPGQTYAHVLWIARFDSGDIVFDEICEDGITEERLHAEIRRRCYGVKDGAGRLVSGLGRPPAWIVLDRAVRRERAWCSENFQQSHIQICESKSEQSIEDGIKILKSLLDPMVGEPRLKYASYLWDGMPRRAIVKCMTNYGYGKQASGGLTRMPFRNNQWDHGCDAQRMHAMKRYGDAHRMLVVQRRHAA